MSDVIITLDGLSGSGKSTQSAMLLHLSFDVGSVYASNLDNVFGVFRHLLRAIVDLSSRRNAFNTFVCNASLLRSLYLGNNGLGEYPVLVLEDCFFSFLYDYYFYSDLDLDDMFPVLDIFNSIMGFDDIIVPDVSFYLMVDQSESRRRMFTRDCGFIGGDLIFSDVTYDSKSDEFYDWLNDNISYLYIIDGMQSEEDVHLSIVDVLKSKGII